MKKILFAIFLIPSILFSQEAPKHTSVIQVKNVSFASAVNTLLDAGYTIDKLDKDFQTVTTERKAMYKNSGWYISINIRIKDSTATIKGICGFTLMSLKGEFDKNEYVIENRGSGNSLPKESFRMMNELAERLGSEISYASN